MRRVLLFVLVTAIIFTAVSCKEGEVNSRESSKPELSIDNIELSNSNYKIILNIPLGANSSTSFFYNQPTKYADAYNSIQVSNQYIKEKYSDLDGWYDYLKKNFGINLEVNYISPMYNSDIFNGEYYINNIRDGELSGLILIEYGNYNSMVKLKNSGMILPLDEYIAQSEVYSSLPKEMKESGRMADNRTWAIPAGYCQQIYGRYYRSSWLKNLEMDTPKNIDELYEVIKAFALNDPNQNGENDEIGLSGRLYDGPAVFGDIFLANECYLINSFTTSISYDYSTRAYEDAALKPEMGDALEYIKNLIDQGFVTIDNSANYTKNDSTGTFYGLNDIKLDNGIYDFEYATSQGKANSVMGVNSERFYVLAQGTENPASVVNGFLKTFYSTTNGMLSGVYGIEDKDFIIDESVLKLGTGPYINVINYLPYLDDKGINKVITQENYGAEVSTAQYDLFSSLYAQNLLIVDPGRFPHEKYTNLNDYFSKHFIYYFMGVYGNMSTEDFISVYISEMKKMGAQQILDDLNQEAKTTAKYGY